MSVLDEKENKLQRQISSVIMVVKGIPCIVLHICDIMRVYLKDYAKKITFGRNTRSTVVEVDS